MYEELMKGLRSVDEYDTEYAKIIYDAADAIEDLENRLNLWRQDKIRRWISVEERLPDENDVVLITDSIDVGTGYLIHGYGWVSPFDDIDMSHVSHWMPLPQPPKENKE